MYNTESETTDTYNILGVVILHGNLPEPMDAEASD